MLCRIPHDIISYLSLLSVLIPVYNEEELVGALIERVLNARLPEGVLRELIVVDDGSTDASLEVVSAISSPSDACIRIVRHARNRGKGAAIRTAIQHASGEVALSKTPTWSTTPRSTHGYWPLCLRARRTRYSARDSWWPANDVYCTTGTPWQTICLRRCATWWLTLT